MPARLASIALVTVMLCPVDAWAQLDDAHYTREAIRAARTAVSELQARAGAASSDSLAQVLEPIVADLEPHLVRLELSGNAGGSVSFRALARMHHTPFDRARATDREAALASDFDAMRFSLTIGLLDLYDRELGADRRRALFAPLDTLNKHGHQAALNRNTEALRRYELKYGPGSPRLNLVEATLNHVLQTSALFGPGLDGPGPWELITGYSSSYGTIADDRLRVLSAVELGLRHYFYAQGWGNDDGLIAYLRPRFLTFGMLVSAAEDGALRLPGGTGRSRLGGFVSWGGVKLAYIGGDAPRVMLSRQIHLIPNVF